MFLDWKNQHCENDYTITHKAFYRFSAIRMKLPMAVFTELEQKNSQFVRKNKRLYKAKAIWQGGFLTTGPLGKSPGHPVYRWHIR